MGLVTDCKAGLGQIVPTTAKAPQNGRAIFRTDNPIAIQANLTLYATTGRQSLSGTRILRAIRIVPVIGGQIVDPGTSLIPSLQTGVAGNFNLRFGATFNQKSTNWCWAYASYHTLRTYYDTIPAGADPVADSWRAALATLNTNQAFWNYMEKHIPMGQLGSPHQFVDLIRRTNNLPSHKKWSYASMNSRETTVKNIEENLKKGIPTSYCRSGHCVMIYGFKYDGARATEFLISDSSGSRLYSEAISRVAQRYTAIWTQPASINTSYRGEGSSNQAPESNISDSYYEANPASTGARE